MTMKMTLVIRCHAHPLASARRKSWWISKHPPRYQNLHRCRHHRRPVHRCSPERRPPCNSDLTVALKPPLPFQPSNELFVHCADCFPHPCDLVPATILVATTTFTLSVPQRLTPFTHMTYILVSHDRGPPTFRFPNVPHLWFFVS